MASKAKDGVVKKLNWPDSMWPINLDFLNSIPQELLPDIDILSRVNYPWDLLTCLREQLKAKIVENRISVKATISNNVEITGPVWIEDDVLIHPFSVIIGPTYIEKGAIVGNFTQIRESFIGQKCLVGERTSVVRSVIGKGCSFHRNYLSDSLLSKDIAMGGGTTAANQRLDHGNVRTTIGDSRIDTGRNRLGTIIGENAKFGTTCQIMPGVKIGKNCMVDPRVVLYIDLADNMRCKVKQELQFEKILNK